MRIVLLALVDEADETTPELLKLKKSATKPLNKNSLLDEQLALRMPEAQRSLRCEKRIDWKDADGEYLECCGATVSPYHTLRGIDDVALQKDLRTAFARLPFPPPIEINNRMPPYEVRKPGIKGYFTARDEVPHTVFAYPASQVKDIAIHLARKGNRAAREAFAHHKRKWELETQPGSGTPIDASNAATYAVSLNGPKTAGTYFNLEELPDVIRQLPNPIKSSAVIHKAVERLSALGIKRAGYFGHGMSSLVLETVPDNEGRMQLVTLTPDNQKPLDHPAMVPDKYCETIHANGTSYHLRISVALDRSGVRDEDTVELIRIFKDSGLEPWDLQHLGYIKNHNTLIWHGKNGERLPFCADRDAVRWNYAATDSHKQECMRRWPIDPALEAHRLAVAEMRGDGKIHNTLDKERAKKLIRQRLRFYDFTPSSTLGEAIDKGLYASEIQQISETALAESASDTDPGQGWVEKYRKGIETADPTLPPRPRS